ncbi:Sm_multidrug_ex domain-containing protein [Cephalotus follicularis]|uniref:Sm_multidrug_ex domain-containing protein n=1 Tax=Cephalotus follicularis TaxID=3775 RepID=A0A1Q3CH56_CEPFO|nr:Sm_multidrug_ex domain-containing protein [Cephalotus follicularis]
MAASVSPLKLGFSYRKTHLQISPNQINPSITRYKPPLLKSNPYFTFQNPLHLPHHVSSSLTIRASSASLLDTTEDETQILPSFEEKPVKTLFWVVFWASLSLVWFATSGDVNAAVDSIKASSFGLKIANSLRRSGWTDEAVVFALATLPVLELRGAIPVGYWMQLKPILLTVLSVLGNMVPVPFIILYLKRFASFLAGRNQSVSWFLDMLFQRAKEKAGPVEEFQWLGLMLFVAVPFPGTGAWTGAIIASILDMPFWPAVTANFCGVVLAGLLMNLLVNLGLMYAVVTAMILFLISTSMWSILRNFKYLLSSFNDELRD